uniref:Immunodominant membrane protein n=1 Tax=Sesame phyllody phytoplasma TaxID=420408 RepID=A0A7L8YRJ9_9MOLU|nr:immunodominant membrane protein [Sesame phyllody phytoplasma]
MQQKENLLSTQKGKIIAVSSGLVGVVVIYLLLAWLIGFWPFSSLTKGKIEAMIVEPEKLGTTTVAQPDADTKTKKLLDGYNKLKAAADKLNVNKDDVVTQLNSLKGKIDTATKESAKTSDFNSASFTTAYDAITKDDFKLVADAIIKAADLK